MPSHLLARGAKLLTILVNGLDLVHPFNMDTQGRVCYAEAKKALDSVLSGKKGYHLMALGGGDRHFVVYLECGGTGGASAPAPAPAPVSASAPAAASSSSPKSKIKKRNKKSAAAAGTESKAYKATGKGSGHKSHKSRGSGTGKKVGASRAAKK